MELEQFKERMFRDGYAVVHDLFSQEFIYDAKKN